MYPCPTLQVRPRDRPRMARGQDGSLLLSCMTLTFTTPRRFIPTLSSLQSCPTMQPAVRPPPQSGWLNEWYRLKGGHLLSLGVALKRAFVNGSELSVCSIRGFLLADVLADLLQFKADRGGGVTAGPEMFAREIPLLTAQPGNGDCTLPLHKSHHGSHRVLGGNRDTHMHMVRHQMSFNNLTLLLPG